VYDITSFESFNNARKWLTELRDHSDSNIVVLLAGNKNDLSHLRAVSVEQAHEFANSEDLTTIETSALNSSNVEQAFTDLLSMTYSVMCKETLQGASPSVSHRQDIIELSSAARSSTRKCCD
jgi:Ras-related protein Rab-11A